MGRVKELSKNTIYVFIGSLGSKLISVLMLPFYTRWLTSSDYGIVDMITVYQSLLVGVVTGAIAEAIFVFPKNETFENQKQYFSSGLIFSLFSFFIAALLFCIAKYLMHLMGYKNSFTIYSEWIYVFMLLSFLQSYIQQFCRSINKMLVFSLSGAFLTLFTALLSFILIPKLSVEGFIWAMVFANLLTIFLTFILGKLYKYFRIYSFRKVIIKEMLEYSIPLIPNTLMWWLFTSFNRPLLECYCGLSSIGIFAVAQKFPQLISVIFNIFGNSWQITVLDEYGKSDFENFYNKIIAVISIPIVFGVLLMSFFANQLIHFFVGPDFFSAAKYIPLLSVSMLFLCYNMLVSPIFSATRKSKYYFYSSFWSAIGSVILNVLLIPFIGIYGAVVSFTFSHFLITILRVYYSLIFIKINHIKIYVLLCLITFINSLIYVSEDTSILKLSSLAISVVFVMIISLYLYKKLELFSSLMIIANKLNIGRRIKS